MAVIGHGFFPLSVFCWHQHVHHCGVVEGSVKRTKSGVCWKENARPEEQEYCHEIRGEVRIFQGANGVSYEYWKRSEE
ncbi:MAG: hypothetical protein RIC89_05115, partial [Pseudomonadales bacterium]